MPDLTPSEERLKALEATIATLEPLLNAEHSEHGLQGLSGLYGQYLKALEQREQLKSALAKREATLLDEINARRAAKAAEGAPRPAGRRIRR